MLLITVSENMVFVSCQSCFSWRQAYIGQAFRILTGSTGSLFTSTLCFGGHRTSSFNIVQQMTASPFDFSKGGENLPAKPPFKFRASNLFGPYRVFVVSYQEGLFTS